VKALFWKLLAWAIATRPQLVDALINRAKKTPYFHLDGYMRRWWLLPRWLIGADQYGNPFPRAWLPISARVHHILRADNERELHDHPFDYRTIILKGWYVEEDIFGELHYRGTGDTVANRAQTFHRIATVSPGGVWTLFIISRRINRWGFLVGGRKVYYKDYFGQEA
jgi:hypothetical protein